MLLFSVNNIKKNYGKHTVLNGLNIEVTRGSIFALLGENGAGKPTAVRILATLLQPDAGHARILGHELAQEADAIRQRVSLTGQFASLDEDLTGMENLIMIAWLIGYSRKKSQGSGRRIIACF